MRRPVGPRLTLAVALGCTAAGVVPAAENAAVSTGAPIRQEIVVTNQNMAVVRDVRRVDLPAGAVALAWTGVAASARTETWSLENARAAGVRWLGLSAPLAAPGALSALVGKRVRVERPGGGSVEAEVVAVSGPTPAEALFREGADLVFGEPGARLVLASGAGAPSPGVTLRLTSEKAGARELACRYLVADMGWEADYALALAPDEKSGRLEGWFTVDNRTGTAFAPTRLRLLAGVLRTAATPMPRSATFKAEAAVVAGGVASSEAASESRLYEIPSPGPLADGRTTFPLADNAEVLVEKRYVARSTFWFGENAEAQTVPVAVLYHVGAKTLSAALPAGVVRVYTEGGALFGGEDHIGHTPAKTDFEIETSEAFDLTARRRQTGYTQVGPRETESAWEVTVVSRKADAVAVLVRDAFPGDWSLVSSSVEAQRKSARLVEFALPVPAGGEVVLTYRVRVRTGR